MSLDIVLRDIGTQVKWGVGNMTARNKLYDRQKQRIPNRLTGSNRINVEYLIGAEMSPVTIRLEDIELKTDYITITQAVNLDDIEAAVSTLQPELYYATGA